MLYMSDYKVHLLEKPRASSDKQHKARNREYSCWIHRKNLHIRVFSSSTPNRSEASGASYSFQSHTKHDRPSCIFYVSFRAYSHSRGFIRILCAGGGNVSPSVCVVRLGSTTVLPTPTLAVVIMTLNSPKSIATPHT